MSLPEYAVMTVTGAPHAQRFTVRCKVAASGIEASGEGSSRRAAEQSAAQAALDGLNELWNRSHE
jgi:ribonuclease-3